MGADKNLPETLQTLTLMERRVLSLIAENKTSKEIAETLFISYRTVQNHRYNISQKLNLKGSNKLLEFALSNRDVLLASAPVADSSEPAGDIAPASQIPVRRRRKRWVAASLFIGLAAVLLVVWLARDELSSRFGASSSEIEPDRTRIAVMPFQLIGPDSAETYLSDGFTEEMITQISQIPELRVIARTSVMPFKNAPKPLEDIARELRVGAVLEGSVQREGSQVRVSVRLIDTQRKENLWGRTFDDRFSDILKIQREIAWQVAMALQVELYLKGLSDHGDVHVVSDEAFTAYLKGRYFVNQTTAEGFQRGIEFYRKAIDIDSTYARAWAGLADVYVWLSNYGIMTPDKAFAESRKAAQKALALAPELGEAHTAKASIALLYDWDFGGAEIEFQKAIALNPSDVIAHRLYALLQLAKGNPTKAIEHSQITIRLDPLSVISNALHGRVYYFARRFTDALAQYQTTLEIGPDFWLVHSYVGEAHLELGNHEEAIAALRKASDMAPDSYTALARLGYGYAVTGNRDEAEKILKTLIENSREGKSLSFQIALIYGGFGEKESAFAWMQKAYDNRHDFMLDLQMDPKLDPLRSDPRFTDFLQKMGFDN